MAKKANKSKGKTKKATASRLKAKPKTKNLAARNQTAAAVKGGRITNVRANASGVLTSSSLTPSLLIP